MGACDTDFKHHLDRCKYPQRYSNALGTEHHARQAVEVLLKRQGGEKLKTAEAVRPQSHTGYTPAINTSTAR